VAQEPPTVPPSLSKTRHHGAEGTPFREGTTKDAEEDPYFEYEEEISTLRLRKKQNVPPDRHTVSVLSAFRKSTVPADREVPTEASSLSLSTISLSDLLHLSHDRFSTITGSTLFRLFLVLFLGLLLGVLLAVLWELWL
ncbi:MAG: hypothetical protein D6812_17265, partial [Deltaproteobacteria bacterium]